MDYESRAALSFYQEIAPLNQEHKVSLVQHLDTKKVYVKKVLSVYNISIYKQLLENPIAGIPAIQLIYEEDNTLTLIEEYVSGTTVSDLLATKGAFSEAETIEYISQLCITLNNLHESSTPLIHRDIKPSNIIITPDSKAVLIDFNAARADVQKEEDTRLLGTKGYAAPEQYGFGSSGPRTDIYALGMLMNTMLYGDFNSDPYESPLLGPVIQKCIEINPKDRYSSVKELSAAISKPIPSATVKEKKYYSKLIPGFRSLNPTKMIIASLYYLFFFWVTLTLQVENTYGLNLWYDRIFCLFIFLAIPMCALNYLGIHKYIPFCKSKNKIISFIGKVLFTSLTVVVLFCVLVFTDLLFFK